MSDDFINANYKIPSSLDKQIRPSDFEQGETVIRILSWKKDYAIKGFEYWTAWTNPKGDVKRRPIRVPEGNMDPMDNVPIDKKADNAKYFWGLSIYNYNKAKIQILIVTQNTIINAINALFINAKWGSPVEYDLSISKTGEKLNTEYLLTPNPREPLDPEIESRYKQLDLNLNVMFSTEEFPFGQDPFSDSVEVQIDGDHIDPNEMPF